MKVSSKKPKHVLILQSDWEGGISLVAKDLITNGIKVTKVITQAGDWVYKLRGIPCLSYDAPLDQFKDWLTMTVKECNVDCILLYNEFRPYNQIGYDLAEELGIECIILELGLLRPDYVTIYSREHNLFEYLSTEWDKVRASGKPVHLPENPPRLRVASSVSKITLFARGYIFSRMMTKLCRKYTHYVDQRDMSFKHHFACGVKAQLRFQGRTKQDRYNRVFAGRWSKKYYLVPLQVHCDSQIRVKSQFDSIEQFITHVVDSFEKYAPKHTRLVFKVHPIDRGYKDYVKLIHKLDERFDSSRLLYVDRVNNPIAIANAIGTITINSSMGLFSLIEGTPVKTLGKATFDLEGLTYQGDLNSFWHNTEPVNRQNVSNFVALLRRTSQGKGTFYQRSFALKGHAKIQWPEEFAYLFPSQE